MVVMVDMVIGHQHGVHGQVHASLIFKTLKFITFKVWESVIGALNVHGLNPQVFGIIELI